MRKYIFTLLFILGCSNPDYQVLINSTPPPNAVIIEKRMYIDMYVTGTREPQYFVLLDNDVLYLVTKDTYDSAQIGGRLYP